MTNKNVTMFFKSMDRAETALIYLQKRGWKQVEFLNNGHSVGFKIRYIESGSFTDELNHVKHKYRNTAEFW